MENLHEHHLTWKLLLTLVFANDTLIRNLCVSRVSNGLIQSFGMSDQSGETDERVGRVVHKGTAQEAQRQIDSRKVFELLLETNRSLFGFVASMQRITKPAKTEWPLLPANYPEYTT